MTPVQAFTVGFLMKCAEDGLTPPQIQDRMERFAKTAAMPSLSDVGKTIMDFPGQLYNLGAGATNLAGQGAGLGLKGLLLSGAAGGGLGALGGLAMAQAGDDNIEPAEVKQEEMIAEYRRAIAELARRRQIGLA